ncbi:biogenesis of lysosome-related organelles complex 1 subunit 3 [Aplochiton taeniatus]
MSSVSSRYPIVVQGEASETDSDDEVYITSLSAPPHRVLGEASETDSEGERATPSDKALVLERRLPPLIVVRPNVPSTGERVSPAGGLGSGSLLQQKLQESNVRLCGGVASLTRQVYSSASRDLGTATAHLNGSQGAIINASHSIRLVLHDLRAVSETIDIITSCHLLPDITIDSACPGR